MPRFLEVPVLTGRQRVSSGRRIGVSPASRRYPWDRFTTFLYYKFKGFAVVAATHIPVFFLCGYLYAKT